MIKLRSLLFSGLAALSGAAGPAAAHDFWIQPATFTPAPGQTIPVHLRVGEDFPGDPVPRNPERIERFVVVDAQGARPIEGAPGVDPAGIAKIGTGGTQWLVYRGRPVGITLDAAKFTAYLREEGLEAIVEERQARGLSRTAGRERYARDAKSLVGTGEGVAIDRPLGLPLEIVPLTDPRRPDVATWEFRVLYQGAPLEGVLVRLAGARAPGGAKRARTGADGTARFPAGSAGLWRVVAVHMTGAAAGSAPEADWQSDWASLTFERPAVAGPGDGR